MSSTVIDIIVLRLINLTCSGSSQYRVSYSHLLLVVQFNCWIWCWIHAWVIYNDSAGYEADRLNKLCNTISIGKRTRPVLNQFIKASAAYDVRLSCNNEPTEVPQALTFMLDVHRFSYYKLPSIHAFPFKYSGNSNIKHNWLFHLLFHP